MKTISDELAEVLLPAIEHALQNVNPGPLTTELFGELLLTQSYTPELVDTALDEAGTIDCMHPTGMGRDCIWFLIWDYGSQVSHGAYISAYYARYNAWKGVSDGN